MSAPRASAALAAALGLAAALAAPLALAAAIPATRDTAGAALGAPPKGPGIPELVWVVGIEGVPSDSLLHAGFDRGFAAAFAENSLRTERVGADGHTPIASLPVTNHFRLLYGDSGFGAWQLQASLAFAPPVKGAKRPPPVEVTLIVHSPAMVEANARPLPVRVKLVASDAPASALAFSRALGQAVARLALEHMSHLDESLPEDERLRIEGFDREAAASDPAPVRR
jgi:hypothetical protein